MKKVKWSRTSEEGSTLYTAVIAGLHLTFRRFVPPYMSEASVVNPKTREVLWSDKYDFRGLKTEKVKAELIEAAQKILAKMV